MVTKSYNLSFEGYWREPKAGGLPPQSGIYCVYGCIHNVSANTVSLKRLIYIGEAENVRDRMASHEKRSQWKRHLGPGEELCVNAALISPQSDRERAEAAMIFKHKPPCNDEYVNGFPFDRTTIRTSGKSAFLSAEFTVQPTDARTLLNAGR